MIGPGDRIAVTVAPAAAFRFVCPRCKGDLAVGAASYWCSSCQQTYPILLGIPDFRLRSDRYLSLEQERAKAQRLYDFAQGSSFAELVRYYYSITNDVPEDSARRYSAYIQSAPQRARYILDDLQPKSDSDTLIDLGCGTGGLLIAAEGSYRAKVGVDIALRWLVICQKRLVDHGVRATLVCADVEALPFPEGSFTHAVAADLVEHVYQVDNTLQQIWRHLEPNGLLWLSAANRYSVGPHASTRIWGIGFLSKRWGRRVLQILRGIDPLRHTNLVSPGALAATLGRNGFWIVTSRPKPIHARTSPDETRTTRVLVAAYRLALRVEWLDRVLFRIGPAFEMVCQKEEAMYGCLKLPSDAVLETRATTRQRKV